MTNIDKICKVIDSCKTVDHIITCHKWINDLCNKNIITQNEYIFLFNGFNIKWIEISYE